MNSILSTWLSPNYLRSLLLEPDKSKSTCIQIARFCAAYYLDYILFLPQNDQLLPSLYIWGSIEKEEDIPPSSIILDRSQVSQLLPPEYSPALPALLLVQCDHIIEAISYIDHFDDKRSAIILRLLADSIHEKDLTSDYIRTMILDNIQNEIDHRKTNTNEQLTKFATQLSQSILELDVTMHKDFLSFFEDCLLSNAEFIFSQLPLPSLSNYSNPIYRRPFDQDTDEGVAFGKIYSYVHILLTSLSMSNRIVEQMSFTLKLVSGKQVSSTNTNKYVIHRLLLLMLRLTQRKLFSDAIKYNQDDKLPKIAEKYKILLNEEEGEVEVIQKFASCASEKEMESFEEFFNYIDNNYPQNNFLPPLSHTTRDLWLRQIVLNNSTDHRDIRQEKTINWFRLICSPKHKVCDVIISQMLLINSQWTSPGFSYIPPGYLALRLSIHPHDVCLGTNTMMANHSMTARDVLYTSSVELELDNDKEKLFTPRNEKTKDDLISQYARKHRALIESQTSRTTQPIDEQLRIFSRQQNELQMELDREREFLSRTGRISTSMESEYTKSFGLNEQLETTKDERMTDEALVQKLSLLNDKIDSIVKSLEEKRNTIYIREDDEESIVSELPFYYDNAPVTTGAPTIEKLDLDILTGRMEGEDKQGNSGGQSNIGYTNGGGMDGEKGSEDGDGGEGTDRLSIENPLFQSTTSKQQQQSTNNIDNIPLDWMKLLPLEPSSAKYIDNLLIYDGNKTNMEQKMDVSSRKVVSDRGIQTRIDGRITRIGETQTDSGFLDDGGGLKTKQQMEKKYLDGKMMKKMSKEDIQMVINRVTS